MGGSKLIYQQKKTDSNVQEINPSDVILPFISMAGTHLHSWVKRSVLLKCLAQGHTEHGLGDDSNPHYGDSAIRIQVWCAGPLDH